jgi:hypothetical protein
MVFYLSSGFRNTEESEPQGEETECSEEDVGAPSDGLEHVRRDKANNATGKRNVRPALRIEPLQTSLTNCTSM